MSGVIYADVLVVINFYVTYFILKSTALLCKDNPDRLRMTASSFLGGLYSLTVLLPEKIQGALFILRMAAAVIFVLSAFGYMNVRVFLRRLICFVLVSFIFAGLMLAVWYFICPSGMFFNGSVVYFDIDIALLAIMTVISYMFLKLFDWFFRKNTPSNIVYRCCFEFDGRACDIRAFLDTGNKLTDPFTGNAVIVANGDSFGFSDKYKEDAAERLRLRFVACSGISGTELLPAFTAENIHIKGAERDFFVRKATVALTDKKLFQGEFDAILPLELFDNNFHGKDERESEKNTFGFAGCKRVVSSEVFSFTDFLCQRSGESAGTFDERAGRGNNAATRTGE